MSLTNKRLAGAGDDKMDAVDRRRKEVQAKLRGMIREAVRTKLGLLNEGNFKGNTVSKMGRTLTVSVTDGRISGSTSSNVKDEVLIGMEIYDAPVPNALELADRVVFWDAELLTETLKLGGFTYVAADAILASRPSRLYTLVVRFGTFDTASKESVESVQLVTSFQFDSNVAPPAATAAATPPAATAAATPPAATAAATPPAADVIEPVATPQQASMSVQDKIRKGAQAIAGANYDDQVTTPIDIDTVAAQNAMKNHVWVKNEDREAYKLNDWSKGDAYTYFALVNTKTNKPVAFVVASDPEDNNHFSTGRFIGPNSTKPNLREAFCILYRRATGEEHPSCVKKGGARKSGETSAGGDASTGTAAAGATKLVNVNGTVRRGSGDLDSGPVGVRRAAEKLRKNGRVFITRSHNNVGFTDFPMGPIKLNAVRSIRVKFKYPMAIDPNTNGYNSKVDFGSNTRPEHIELIQLSGAWGLGTVWVTHGNKLEPGKNGFVEAAQWVFDNPGEFDLAPDGVKFEDADTSTKTSAEKKTASADSTATAAAAGVKPAANTGEAMTEGRRRPSLMDLYRF